MNKIFGNFVEPDNGREYLVIHFSPTSVPLQQRWRNNGLSADFISEYWSTFFPICNLNEQERVQEIKSGISYVANELLENIMKFTYAPAEHPVELGLYLYEEIFRFYASNAIDPNRVADFQSYIQRLQEEDATNLYLAQVEFNAMHPESGSKLGLLTMMNDYQARLAWKFQSTQTPQTIVVTTMVELDL